VVHHSGNEGLAPSLTSIITARNGKLPSTLLTPPCALPLRSRATIINPLASSAPHHSRSSHQSLSHHSSLACCTLPRPAPRSSELPFLVVCLRSPNSAREEWRRRRRGPSRHRPRPTPAAATACSSPSTPYTERSASSRYYYFLYP
jgi:hypothetical protein